MCIRDRTGSLAHNRRDFIAENVDPDRVQLNICYRNENEDPAIRYYSGTAVYRTSFEVLPRLLARN